MRLVLASWLVLVTAASLVGQKGIHPDEIKLKPEIDKAIAQGVEALINSQFRDGTWGQYGRFKGGKTALCTYALLKCGVDNTHPAIRRALLFLDPIRPTETYTVGCMLMAYGATGLEKYRKRMGELASLLIDWQKGGGDFSYPNGATDLSNTQYAALGLWTAQKYKIKVPTSTWVELIHAVTRYAEKPKRIAAPATTGVTTISNGGTIEIAGFGYRRGQKPTGSMTTAGVSILQICKIGLGSKMVGQRRVVDRAIDAGVNWLGHNFAVDKNPGKGDWGYYYLYGLERVGSLIRIEKMGDYWWYLEGARHLLSEQTASGHWPGGGQLRECRTSFALLFLRRATSWSASTTGKRSQGGGTRHIFSVGTAKDHDVSIGGAGQQPLALWVSGFGDALKERHKVYGLRIVQVEYLEGDQILGQVAGTPTKAWQLDTFLHRATALHRGDHKIVARIELVAPEVAPGETTKTEAVRSPEMTVTIRDVFAPWMKEAARMVHANLIAFKRIEAAGSTATMSAKRAFDGNESTHWICAAADPDPTLTVDLGKSIFAKKLMLSQAGSRATDIGLFDRIVAIEVRINKSKPFRVALDPDQLAITTIPIAKGRKVRRLELRIVEREPGRRKGQAGFTEIALIK